MRLIDADVLIRKFKTASPMAIDGRARQMVEEMPTTEPKRKAGRWLPDNRPGGGFWMCSECKFPSEAFAANVLYKFCPNCGAYMGGEQDGKSVQRI